MMTKAKIIRQHEMTIARLRRKIINMQEELGVKAGYAKKSAEDSEYWKHQCFLWQRKCTMLEDELRKEKRKSITILQDPDDEEQKEEAPDNG